MIVTYWIELHCDGGLDNPRCANMHHNYPQFLIDTLRCKTRLEQQAKYMGWKITKTKAFCPACK